MPSLPAKPDAQMLRMIETAKAAGLRNYRVTKRGREFSLEVQETDPEADDTAARIERMAADGSQ